MPSGGIRGPTRPCSELLWRWLTCLARWPNVPFLNMVEAGGRPLAVAWVGPSRVLACFEGAGIWSVDADGGRVRVAEGSLARNEFVAGPQVASLSPPPVRDQEAHALQRLGHIGRDGGGDQHLLRAGDQLGQLGAALMPSRAAHPPALGPGGR